MRIDFKTGTFYLGNCFEVMATLPAAHADLILNDPPYGTTQNKWDAVIPFAPMWAAYWRLAKPSTPVVLTATMPFAAALLMSAIAEFKYNWVWEKTAPVGFLNAKKQPLRTHEMALVFARGAGTYNPQMTQGHLIKRVNVSYAGHGENYGKQVSVRAPYESTERYPRDVLLFPKDNRMGRPHPTQKPVSLFEYLIRTYTNTGGVVIDPTAGSGTTAVAAIRSGRRWVCIEKDEGYFEKAIARIWDEEAAHVGV